MDVITTPMVSMTKLQSSQTVIDSDASCEEYEYEEEEEISVGLQDQTLSAISSTDESEENTTCMDDTASQENETPSTAVTDAKTKTFRKTFSLDDQNIINDFACAYLKKILWQGRMYISQDYICFYANIFGFRTTVEIPFEAIKSIEKKTTALFVPNAIEIITKDNVSHFFGSLIYRDNTYRIIDDLWREHASRSSLTNNNTTNADLMEGYESGSESTISGNDDSFSQSRDRFDTEAEIEYGTDDENETESVDDEMEGGEGEDEDDSDNDKKTNNLPPAQDKAKHRSKKRVSGGGTKSARRKESQEGPVMTQESDRDSPVSSKPVTTTPSTGQSSTLMDDDFAANLEEHAPESPFHDISEIPGNDMFHDLTKLKMREVVTGVLEDCSVVEAFAVLWADSTSFFADFRISRGDTDIKINNWTHSIPTDVSGGVGKLREVTMVTPVKAPIGPKTTRVVELQRAVFTRQRHALLVHVNSISLDAPYGDSFRLEVRIEMSNVTTASTSSASANGGHDCQVRILMGVNFVKNPFFKSKIEDAVNTQVVAVYSAWLDMAKQRIRDVRTAKQLAIDTHTPHSQTTVLSSKRASKKRTVTHDKAPISTTAPILSVRPEGTLEPQTATSTTIGIASQPSMTTAFSTTTRQSPDTHSSWITSLTSTVQTKIELPLWSIIVVLVCIFAFIIPIHFSASRNLDRLENAVLLHQQQATQWESAVSGLLWELVKSNPQRRAERSTNATESTQNIEDDAPMFDVRETIHGEAATANQQAMLANIIRELRLLRHQQHLMHQRRLSGTASLRIQTKTTIRDRDNDYDTKTSSEDLDKQIPLLQNQQRQPSLLANPVTWLLFVLTSIMAWRMFGQG